MQAKQIVARVEELVKPLCEQAGVSLWDVEFEKEAVIRIIIEYI